MKHAPPPPPPPNGNGQTGFGKPRTGTGHRIVLFGPGGIGKTTLAATAPGPVVFFDLDDSLSRLADGLPDPAIVYGAESWDGIRKALRADAWSQIKTIVIDSATKAEELAVAHTLASVKNDKGATVASIEGYGFGKGYQHVFDTFLPLLADLDSHVRAGRNVILVCHDCTATVPNPAGDDWIRYEPRLQGPSSGKASIRLRVREWADHVLFIGYDIDVRDGKGRGCGTRTIYPVETPVCMAKSRSIANPMPLAKGDKSIWDALLQQGGINAIS